MCARLTAGTLNRITQLYSQKGTSMTNWFVLHLREQRPQEAVLCPTSLFTFASNVLCAPECLLTARKEAVGACPFLRSIAALLTCGTCRELPGGGGRGGWGLVLTSYREAAPFTDQLAGALAHLGAVTPQETGSQPAASSLGISWDCPNWWTHERARWPNGCIKGRKSVATELNTTHTAHLLHFFQKGRSQNMWCDQLFWFLIKSIQSKEWEKLGNGRLWL